MITCYIIDDDPMDMEVLSIYIARIPYLILIGSDSDPFAALQYLRHAEKPDLIFIAVELAPISGIDFVQLLDPSITTVFTTSQSKYLTAPTQTAAMDFLLKPFSFDLFLKCTTKVFHQLLPAAIQTPCNSRPCIFINSQVKGKLLNVIVQEVIYIQAMEHSIIIHLKEEQLQAKVSIKQMELKLPRQQFIRIHRTFMINLLQVQSLEAHQLTLKNGVQLPIGNAYRDDLLSRI